MSLPQKFVLKIRTVAGRFLTIISGFFLVPSLICTFAALFGGLETTSLEERSALFAIFLLISILCFLLLRLGLRLRRKPKTKIPPPPQPVPVEIAKPSVEPTPPPSRKEEFLPEPAAPPKNAPPVPAKKSTERKPPSQATPYTRTSRPYEVPCANRESLWEKESSRFLYLSDAHIAPELDWGESEFFAVNTDTWNPYYIITQYDGAHVARTWYTVKEPVTWEEVEQYASETCRTMLGGKAGAPWKNLAVYRESTPKDFLIRWRISQDHISGARITVTEEGFSLTHIYPNSNRKDRQATLSFADAALESTFRKAIRSLFIHEDYILKQLWDFAYHNRPTVVPPKKVPSSRPDWVKLYGHPSGHGDQISLGKREDIYVLRITNDGYPDRMAGGGMDYPLPDHILQTGKLNMRRFEVFYREKFPNGPKLDYSNCSWFAPVESPDSDKPQRLELLHLKHTPLDNSCYSFEGDTLEVELVLWKQEHYLRVIQTRCTAENNSRPFRAGSESFYKVPQDRVPEITKSNWKSFTQGEPTVRNHIIDSM